MQYFKMDCLESLNSKTIEVKFGEYTFICRELTSDMYAMYSALLGRAGHVKSEKELANVMTSMTVLAVKGGLVDENGKPVMNQKDAEKFVATAPAKLVRDLEITIVKMSNPDEVEEEKKA
ncbi:hypothetical protein CF138_17340 [Aeromonas hydrophila]|nr:hypothetical protein CF138_17340 [Aeromonas hydrophila]TNI00250.1 hypothetical protein CF136_10645 [Aeromonas hydrophila]TNI92869.1 hypothetical protein CF118_17995 [Aeromonas hydrophila]